MNLRIAGAVVGLAAGWLAAAALQRIVGWLGAPSLLVILTIGLGVIVGAGVRGLTGALIGGVLGAVLGGLAVRLFFLALKLIAMVVGAATGWRLAGEDRRIRRSGY
jgi:hypothetical protein